MDRLDWGLLLGGIWLLGAAVLALLIGPVMREDKYLFGFCIRRDRDDS